MKGEQVLGGSVTYAALTARSLGWDVAVLTAAGPDFNPDRDLPGVPVFMKRSSGTTRFQNDYLPDGRRQQTLTSRADDVDVSMLPDGWWNPDVLLLGPVAGELPGVRATAFQAQTVGALAQGWLRDFEADGTVRPREWPDPGGDLAGVHGLFLSENDLPGASERAAELLAHVPVVAITKGWRGVVLHTRGAVHDVPALPRPEKDPTGAGDVFAAAFLVRYHESADLLDAAVFACCAASCAVEGLGPSALGDRPEVQRRIGMWERLMEEGEWE